ncbi:MAG: DNA translocase FtsK [candidate division Zixibacteria bacterium]|nr:DNA translocase FtsK [candidate division Zixibacteria bacterium]
MKLLKNISADRKDEIFGVLLWALSIFILLSLITYSHSIDSRFLNQELSWSSLDKLVTQQMRNQTGVMGALVSYSLYYLFGIVSFFLPVVLVFWGTRFLFKTEWSTLFKKTVFIFILIYLLGVFFSISVAYSSTGVDFSRVSLGGWASTVMAKILVKIFGIFGSYTLCLALLVVVAVLVTPWKPSESLLLGKTLLGKFYERGSNWWELKRIEKRRTQRMEELKETAGTEEEIEVEEPPPVKEDKRGKIFTASKKDGPGNLVEEIKTSLSFVRSKEDNKIGAYQYPGLSILNEPPHIKPSVTNEELNQTARVLKDTLETFGIGIEGDLVEKSPGPVITRYEFKPAPGIKVNQIMSLSDDLALALQAKRIRIVAPIPGKAAVGVEIPNRTPQTVYLKDILVSPLFQNTQYRLAIALGKTISGEPLVTDLSRMPHLLIAGATGSGKSVCINVILASLLYRLHPEEIRFIMIDPKMLELTVYNQIPHLERPVVTHPKAAERILSETVVEMEERYKKLARLGVRNIEDYNRKKKREGILPYLVIIVDELADLMMSSSLKTEALITRLAQMARAVGIHLILATQRPSVDVITGLIKANFSARVAFQVASRIDSRTIIDGIGAEKLLGNGDMLFIQAGHPEPLRIHGAYISSEETQKLVDFIKTQDYVPARIGVFSREEEKPENLEKWENAEEEDLYKRAIELVVRHRQGSVSLLQRRLGIGYQRSARLIDQMERDGIVGPYDGSKAREVLVSRDYLEKRETAVEEEKEKDKLENS